MLIQILENMLYFCSTAMMIPSGKQTIVFFLSKNKVSGGSMLSSESTFRCSLIVQVVGTVAGSIYLTWHRFCTRCLSWHNPSISVHLGLAQVTNIDLAQGVLGLLTSWGRVCVSLNRSAFACKAHMLTTAPWSHRISAFIYHLLSSAQKYRSQNLTATMCKRDWENPVLSSLCCLPVRCIIDFKIFTDYI